MTSSHDIGLRLRAMREGASLSRGDICQGEALLSERQLMRIEKNQSAPTIVTLDFFVVGAVAAAADLEHHHVDLREPLALEGGVVLEVPLAEGDRREGEVAARARDGVELQFQRLEALLELADDVLVGLVGGALFREAELDVLVVSGLPRLQHVGQQHLVELGEREAAELLRGGDERDVAHDLQSRQNGLRLRVADVAHLEAALEDRADVEEAAVDASEDHVAHVVDVDVAAVGEFLLAPGKVELAVERLREEPLDEGALGGDEGRIEVRVLAVAEAQHVVGILAELLEGLGVVVLVVAVLGIGGRHVLEAEGRERADYELMEFRDGDLLSGLKAARDRVRHGVHRLIGNLLVAAEGRLHDGVDDLLRLEVLEIVVLLDYLEHHGFHSLYSSRSARGRELLESARGRRRGLNCCF